MNILFFSAHNILKGEVMRDTKKKTSKNCSSKQTKDVKNAKNTKNCK